MPNVLIFQARVGIFDPEGLFSFSSDGGGEVKQLEELGRALPAGHVRAQAQAGRLLAEAARAHNKL